jgi:hypothetical protein
VGRRVLSMKWLNPRGTVYAQNDLGLFDRDVFSSAALEFVLQALFSALEPRC